jgi:hypothetical protein
VSLAAHNAIGIQKPLLSPSARAACYAVALVGAGAFLYAIFTNQGIRAWEAWVTNFLFWSGLAQAGVIFSAILQATSARWGRSLKRIAEATGAFMPLSLVVLAVLFLGRTSIFHWIEAPIDGKQAWLNVPFLVARQMLGLIALQLLSALYVYWSVRPDLGLMEEARGVTLPPPVRWITRGWRGLEPEREASQRAQDRLAPVILIAYAVVLTLQSFDFVMSLDGEWYSTLLGGYFFIGNLYLGLAAVAVLGIWARSRLDLARYITTDQFHDLGKLLFGFCMLWAYMFFTQYLVIWYGNLPFEVRFVLHRVTAPWTPLAVTVVAGCFLVPFVMLLSRDVKRNPTSLAAVSIVVIVSMWLERFVLVAPSLWKGEHLPLGAIEVLMTAGFLAAFVLCYVRVLGLVPALPLSDPRLEAQAGHPVA